MNAELQDPLQRKLSFPFAKRHGVLVRGIVNDVADTVCRPGVTPQALAEVRRFVGVPLKLERVSLEVFDSMLRIAYEAGSGAAMQMLEGLDDNTDLAHLAEDIPESSDLLESDDEAPIIRLINALLTQAVKENASDIHIEPYENRLVIRFRVDGVLREVLQTKRAVAPLVVSRIKVMSKLDIAERRLPQDGRISLRIAGRAVDVRVSTLPSGHGERVVLRLLDKQAGRIELTSLGMDPRTQETMDEIIHKPHGIILVTGPTGSGKTTTLYAALERINDNTRNVMTVEDPDRVLHRRHRADPGQHEGRDDVRPRPASHLAAGPRRGHGRRNPRFGDRANRGAGQFDRSPRALHAAYEYRGWRRHPAAGHGNRTVLAVLQLDRRARRNGWCAVLNPEFSRAVHGGRIRTAAVESRFQGRVR